MASINISTIRVRQAEQVVRARNADMTAAIEGVIEQMIHLNSWVSPGADALRQNFVEIGRRYFERYQAAVYSYADFLRETAVRLDATDIQREVNANTKQFG